jgi:hypothetical protein
MFGLPVSSLKTSIVLWTLAGLLGLGATGSFLLLTFRVLAAETARD